MRYHRLRLPSVDGPARDCRHDDFASCWRAHVVVSIAVRGNAKQTESDERRDEDHDYESGAVGGKKGCRVLVSLR
jgi:hypothetical protein